MWPRIVELMLGIWLALSTFIFSVSPLGGFAALNMLTCATIVVIASCLSYWGPTRHARAATAMVGFWLACRSYLASPQPAPPEAQNEFLVGILLLMFAIVPNRAGEPPRSWSPFVSHQTRKTDRPPDAPSSS